MSTLGRMCHHPYRNEDTLQRLLSPSLWPLDNLNNGIAPRISCWKKEKGRAGASLRGYCLLERDLQLLDNVAGDSSQDSDDRQDHILARAAEWFIFQLNLAPISGPWGWTSGRAHWDPCSFSLRSHTDHTSLSAFRHCLWLDYWEQMG